VTLLDALLVLDELLEPPPLPPPQAANAAARMTAKRLLMFLVLAMLCISFTSGSVQPLALLPEQ
jgi:hypothetical protein